MLYLVISTRGKPGTAALTAGRRVAAAAESVCAGDHTTAAKLSIIEFKGPSDPLQTPATSITRIEGPIAQFSGAVELMAQTRHDAQLIYLEYFSDSGKLPAVDQI